MILPKFVYRPDEPPPGSPAPANPEPPDNSVIRQLREHSTSLETQVKEANTALEAANAKLTEIERASLAKEERLELEKQDLSKRVTELEPERDNAGRFRSTLETVFNERLQGVAEESREKVLALVGDGDPATKLERLTNVLALIPSAGRAPVVAGSPANPGLSGVIPPAPGPAPVVSEPKDWGSIDLKDALAATAPTHNVVPADSRLQRPAQVGITP